MENREVTPLQKAAAIRNWKLLQCKGATSALCYLSNWIVDAHVRASARGRIVAIGREIEESIKASYEAYKEEYLQEKEEQNVRNNIPQVD